MGKSDIEWTDEVWNPMRGCRRISPGCGGANGEGGCYAERQGIRQAGPGGKYEGLVKSTPNGPRWTGAAAVDEKKLLEPLSWRKPRTVFVDSMSDLFFEGFTDEQVARAVATMAATPHITYQVLTKRAERMADLLGEVAFREAVYEYARMTGRVAKEAWPLPNVWWGVSCENKQHGLPRLEHLRRTPAAVRFVSFEPLLEDLLGDLGEVDLSGIHWGIIGGESGPRSRPCDLEWIRRLLRCCQNQGVAPFVKQLGARPHVGSAGAGPAWHISGEGKRRQHWRMDDPTTDPLTVYELHHPKCGDPSEWPEDLRVREFPEVLRVS